MAKGEAYGEKPDEAKAMLTASGSVDLEAQKRDTVKHSPAEYRIPTTTKYLYLSLYFALNLGLTIYNKAVLGKVCETPAALHCYVRSRLMVSLITFLVQLPMVTHDCTYRHSFDRLLRTAFRRSISHE